MWQSCYSHVSSVTTSCWLWFQTYLCQWQVAPCVIIRVKRQTCQTSIMRRTYACVMLTDFHRHCRHHRHHSHHQRHRQPLSTALSSTVTNIRLLVTLVSVAGVSVTHFNSWRVNVSSSCYWWRVTVFGWRTREGLCFLKRFTASLDWHRLASIIGCLLLFNVWRWWCRFIYVSCIF